MENLDLVAAHKWMLAFRDAVVENREWLTELDSAIGDADHGANMSRGMSAAIEKLEPEPTTLNSLWKTVGMTLVSTVGGASGPLYGTIFLRMAQSAGEVTQIDGVSLAKALRAGLDGVLARGKAQAGDKTLVDAFSPALDALDTALGAGATLANATQQAADAATKGRDSTRPLVARKGRASYLGERSAGHIDPGAASLTFLFVTLAAVAAQ